jgi:hypothetical protein
MRLSGTVWVVLGCLMCERSVYDVELGWRWLVRWLEFTVDARFSNGFPVEPELIFGGFQWISSRT